MHRVGNIIDERRYRGQWANERDANSDSEHPAWAVGVSAKINNANRYKQVQTYLQNPFHTIQTLYKFDIQYMGSACIEARSETYPSKELI